MAALNREDFSRLEERYDRARAELEESRHDQWHDGECQECGGVECRCGDNQETDEPDYDCD